MLKIMIDAERPEGIWGWALNDLDLDERLLVVLRRGGEVVASARADRLRPDLLEAGIGDGCYGFAIEVTSDVYIEPCGGTIEVLGLDRDGNEAAGWHVRADRLARAFASFRDAAHPAIAGASFLLDNLRDFSPALMGDAVANARAAFLAVRLYGFGDHLWWDEATGEEPTAARYFSMIGERSLRALAAGDLKLIFDMSNEGVAARQDDGVWLRLLHHELAARDVPASQVVLVNQNRMFEPHYRNWCRENNIADRMTVLRYDYYIARLAMQLDAVAMPPTPPRPRFDEDWRHYVCLNFTTARVRTPFVGWLFGRGLAERGFVSFFGFSNSKKGSWTGPVPEWLPEREVAEAGLAELRERGQVLLDLPARETFPVPEFDMGPEDCYARSFFSIVTETDFSDGDLERITEKSIKPLAWGHPVVIVGNPGSLALLRDLGFRTFHPVIDESYDRTDLPAERMRRVQAEIARLCAMHHDELVALRAQLADVIEHNRRHARRGLAARYRDEIEPRLLARLGAL